MNRIKFYAILCLLLATIGAAGSAYVMNTGKNSNNTVEIVQDDKVIRTVDLSRVKERQVFTVSYQGRTNTIETTEGKIRIIKAQCPDKICVKKGYLSKDGLPVVCLPNHLVIRYVENGTLDSMTN